MDGYVPQPMVLFDMSTLGTPAWDERVAAERAERERMMGSGEIPDPMSCPFMTGKTSYPHIECVYTGRPVWVDCTRSAFGEDPVCSYAPVDNSDEARARRLEWVGAQDAR